MFQQFNAEQTSKTVKTVVEDATVNNTSWTREFFYECVTITCWNFTYLMGKHFSSRRLKFISLPVVQCRWRTLPVLFVSSSLKVSRHTSITSLMFWPVSTRLGSFSATITHSWYVQWRPLRRIRYALRSPRDRDWSAVKSMSYLRR